MLVTDEVSPQLWICPCQDLLWWICSYGYATPNYGYAPTRTSYGGYAPPNYGYAPARTSYDGYAFMDMLLPAMGMLLPAMDMTLPEPPMVDMLPWICSFQPWLCSCQDLLMWICFPQP